MRVTVISLLPAPIEKCWDLLKKTSTLIFVAEGVMTYDGAPDLPPEWTVGIPGVNLLPRLHGKLQGDHFVTVTEVNNNDGRIVTSEYGGDITAWNHTMQLREVGPNLCRYTDTIEIQAGWRTPLIWLFANYFYRHRHKRWQALI